MKKLPILPIAIFVAILGCVLAVSANVNSTQMRLTLEQERYNRMVAEQQLLKINSDIKALRSQLAQSKSALDEIKGIVNNGKSAAKDLKVQLDDVSKERDLLKQQIQKLQAPAAPTPAPVPVQ